MEETTALISSTIVLLAHSYIHISPQPRLSYPRSLRKPTPRTLSQPFFKRTNYWMNDFWKSQKRINTLVDVLRIQSFLSSMRFHFSIKTYDLTIIVLNTKKPFIAQIVVIPDLCFVEMEHVWN